MSLLPAAGKALRPRLDGVLVVDKPSGPTSFDIVRDARRHLWTKQIGHAGTLDPLASGVLLVLVGEATKLSPYLTLASKGYRAKLRFGSSTDTFDAEGQVVAESTAVPDVSAEQLELCLAQERQRSLQVPPAYSAIKVGGKTAYSLARKGVAVELAARPCQVSELSVLERDADSLTLQLCVSKGYYVRSLVRDLCQALGVPGHLAALRRTHSGCFTLEEAVAWPPVGETPLLSLKDVVTRALPTAVLTSDGTVRARQGKRLSELDFGILNTTQAPTAWFSPEEEFIAMGALDGSEYRVLRGFNAPNVNVPPSTS